MKVNIFIRWLTLRKFEKNVQWQSFINSDGKTVKMKVATFSALWQLKITSAIIVIVVTVILTHHKRFSNVPVIWYFL
jgi:hypothetical protein